MTGLKRTMLILVEWNSKVPVSFVDSRTVSVYVLWRIFPTYCCPTASFRPYNRYKIYEKEDRYIAWCRRNVSLSQTGTSSHPRHASGLAAAQTEGVHAKVTTKVA